MNHGGHSGCQWQGPEPDHWLASRPEKYYRGVSYLAKYTSLTRNLNFELKPRDEELELRVEATGTGIYFRDSESRSESPGPGPRRGAGVGPVPSIKIIDSVSSSESESPACRGVADGPGAAAELTWAYSLAGSGYNPFKYTY